MESPKKLQSHRYCGFKMYQLSVVWDFVSLIVMPDHTVKDEVEIDTHTANESATL